MRPEIVRADAEYVHRWLKQTEAPANIIGLQARVVAELQDDAPPPEPGASSTAAAYLPGFRDADADSRRAPFCWRMLNDGEDVCIRDRGHDDGIHEPAEVSGGTTTGSARPLGTSQPEELERTNLGDGGCPAASSAAPNSQPSDVFVAVHCALALLVADIPCGNGCGCEEYDYCAEDEGNRALDAFTPFAFAEDLERYTTATGNRSLQDPDSDLRARVVLLEEALRRIAATPNFKSQPWSVEALQRVARAALVGDAPPPNTKTGLGAPPARAEESEPSGDSAKRYQICPRCDGQEHDKGACGLCQNTGILDHEGDPYFPPPGYDRGAPAEIVARLNHMVHAPRRRYG